MKSFYRFCFYSRFLHKYSIHNRYNNLAYYCYDRVITSINPDILVVREIISQAQVDGFLNNVMNTFREIYVAGSYINEPETDGEIFFN